MTISAFSDELAQVRTKKKEFLAQIERIVPWKEWIAMIQPCYYKGERGNKPYPLETMVRLYLLQNLYDLSDEATVAEAIDSRAFSDFCGIDSSNQVPDTAKCHYGDCLYLSNCRGRNHSTISSSVISYGLSE